MVEIGGAMLKATRYLSIFRAEDGGSHCAFNAMTGGIYSLDDAALEKFEHLLEFPGSERHADVKQFMIEEAILIPDDVDELSAIQRRFREGRSSKDELYTTFVLTDACNFRCTYCYQPHDSTHSTEESLKKSIAFVRSQLPSYRSLKVHWFGGEPLIAFNKLTWAAAELIALAKELGVPYSSAITTNGSLLTDERAARLRELKVDQIQITLDGDELDHNKLRLALSGKPTFGAVVAAIKIAVDHGFYTFVRVNLSPRNVDGFPRLLDRLLSAGIDPSKANVYINEMKQHGSSSPDASLYFSSLADFGEKLVVSLREMHKRGFRLPGLRPIDVNCSFDKPSSLLFGTNGDLYHCTTGTDRPLATLSPDGAVLETTERMRRVHTREPWDDATCRECQHLPICMGGCAHLEEDGKVKCNPERFMLEPLVKLIAESHHGERQR